MHVELNQLSVNAGPTLHQPSCSFGNDRRWVSSLRWSLFQPIVISTQLSSVAKFEGSRISGWWFGTFLMFYIFGITTSTDFHIFFQRGSFTTNQISWRTRTHKNYQATPHKKSSKMVSSEVLKSSQSGPPKTPKIMDIDRKKINIRILQCGVPKNVINWLISPMNTIVICVSLTIVKLDSLD